ncbi:MAG: His/Gly/Thr/Pro-type tRNA ligase C-terminal domain-containing protein, partial [Pseudomonadota bacterium]
RKLLDGILESSGVPNTTEGAVQRLQVLRSIDKLDRLGEEGVEALLGEGREDESGAYVEGAKLNAAGIKAVMGFTTASDPDRTKTLSALESLVGNSDRDGQGVSELRQIDALLTATGFGSDRVSFDTSIVRGLGYYTGPVFELELLTDIRDRKGRPVRIGSIGGGGRYDDLVSRFRGQPVPATGFSFGVSRFVTALERMEALQAQTEAPVLITVFDKALLPDYFKLAANLRSEGIRAEVFTGSGNVTKQLKYADKRGVRFAVLMGEDEAQAGQVTVKDLVLGAEMAKAIETNEEWKSTRPAQETISRDVLANYIKEGLAG